eukprot:21901-Pyramimonas_sp.AAC.1
MLHEECLRSKHISLELLSSRVNIKKAFPKKTRKWSDLQPTCSSLVAVAHDHVDHVKSITSNSARWAAPAALTDLVADRELLLALKDIDPDMRTTAAVSWVVPFNTTWARSQRDGGVIRTSRAVAMGVIAPGATCWVRADMSRNVGYLVKATFGPALDVILTRPLQVLTSHDVFKEQHREVVAF